MTRSFDRYIGIDYSGAQDAASRQAGLRVFSAYGAQDPNEVNTAAGDGTTAKHMRWHWSRKELGHWLLEELKRPERTAVAIDHAFSFPDSYFRRYGLSDWHSFLDDFCEHWPTGENGTFVDEILARGPARTGTPKEFRCVERLAKGAQSVFKFVGKGTVGKSTHTGLPWLKFLRDHPALEDRLHFWPFDGFEPAVGKHVIVEGFPSLFRGFYKKPAWFTGDQFDAFVLAKRLQDVDGEGGLGAWFHPESVDANDPVLKREGWILGVE